MRTKKLSNKLFIDERKMYKNYSVEGSEGELALCAGDYLLVWGNGEPHSGYYDAELLDGRRGLVPASFLQRLVGK